MKRSILCEICQHQQLELVPYLHRHVMTCAVRPGIVAEQVICHEFDQRASATNGYIVRQVAK